MILVEMTWNADNDINHRMTKLGNNYCTVYIAIMKDKTVALHDGLMRIKAFLPRYCIMLLSSISLDFTYFKYNLTKFNCLPRPAT